MLPQDEGQPFPPYDFPRECMWRSARLAQGRGGLESLKTGRPPGKLAPSSSLPPGMPQLFPALQAPIRLLASDAPSESPHFLISSTSPRGALWKAVRLTLQQGNTRGRAPPPQRALGYRCCPGAAQSRLVLRGAPVGISLSGRPVQDLSAEIRSHECPSPGGLCRVSRSGPPSSQVSEWRPSLALSDCPLSTSVIVPT